MPKKQAFLFLKTVRREIGKAERSVERLHHKAGLAIQDASIDVCATALPIILEAKDKVTSVQGVLAKAAVQASLFQLGGEPALQLWEMARIHFGVDAGQHIARAMGGELELSVPDAEPAAKPDGAAHAPAHQARAGAPENRTTVGIAYDEAGAWLAVYAGAAMQDGIKIARAISDSVIEASARATLFQLGGEPALQLRDTLKSAIGVDASKHLPAAEIAIPKDLKSRLANLDINLGGQDPAPAITRGPGL